MQRVHHFQKIEKCGEKEEGLPVWGDGGWDDPPEYKLQVNQGPEYSIGVNVPQAGAPRVTA